MAMNQERRTMNAKTERPTAKLYAFPVGGRAYAGANPIETQSSVAAVPEDIVAGDFGGCWYHEAAIQDGKLPRKR
jgi:hypothetical protein